MVCDQAHLKFLVYPDHIKIVPDNFADYESGLLQVNPDPNTDDVPVLSIQDLIRTKPLTKRALVNANFKNKPLAEIRRRDCGIDRGECRGVAAAACADAANGDYRAFANTPG